jgi:hypothetical protein
MSYRVGRENQVGLVEDRIQVVVAEDLSGLQREDAPGELCAIYVVVAKLGEELFDIGGECLGEVWGSLG